MTYGKYHIEAENCLSKAKAAMEKFEQRQGRSQDGDIAEGWTGIARVYAMLARPS